MSGNNHISPFMESQLFRFGLGLAKLEEGIQILSQQINSFGSPKLGLNARTVVTQIFDENELSFDESRVVQDSLIFTLNTLRKQSEQATADASMIHTKDPEFLSTPNRLAIIKTARLRDEQNKQTVDAQNKNEQKQTRSPQKKSPLLSPSTTVPRQQPHDFGFGCKLNNTSNSEPETKEQKVWKIGLNKLSQTSNPVGTFQKNKIKYERKLSYQKQGGRIGLSLKSRSPGKCRPIRLGGKTRLESFF